MAEPVRFQHYEVLRRDDGSLFELGRGAMGITYKAFDTNLRTNVALKVINATYLNSELARQRFLREARAAAAIRHANVATVFHLGNEDDSYFYAMEYIDGETVEGFMQREGAVPTILALEIAAQVARALGAAEKQGLVHRDIKPSNLMLVREDSGNPGAGGDAEFLVKVIDFGLAKAADKDATDTATLTQGGFLGTPHFASPEQLEERELDSRSDIYSLGVTLYYMLAGRTPFSGSLAQVMSQHLHREPPLELLAGQPKPVIALLERMMAKDPDDRPQSPAALRREIEAGIEEVATAKSGVTGGGITEPADEATVVEGAPEPDIFELKPGVTLAERFELLEQYEPGEFGKTFRARNLETEEIVAVLILDPGLLPTSEAYTRLENEVVAVQAVKHPAVIRVHSLERAHQISFLSREWIEGPSLLDTMRRRGALPVGEALGILTSLAGGLEAVQKTGVPCPALSAHWITMLGDAKTGALLPKFNALNFDAVAPPGPDATLVSLPGPRNLGTGSEYVFALAALAYRLLGGLSAPEQPGEAFIPIPGLSEEANLVLRRALKTGRDHVSPVAFVAALDEAMGQIAPSSPRPPALPTVIESARRKGPPVSLLVGAALAVLALGLVGAIVLLSPKPQEPVTADAPPAPSLEPTPEVVAATPEPTPTPDPRVVALDAAIKRAQDMATLEDYAGAFHLIDDLFDQYPEAKERLAAETDKIAAKLGGETDDYLTTGQLAELADLLQEASQRGSTPAQMLLGKSYLPTDPARAFNYFFLAATEGNNSEAMYQLGDLYAGGHGMEKADWTKAAEYFQKAGFHPQAIYALGECYYYGKGVPQDYRRAFELLQVSANQYNNRYAQVLLGDLYCDGRLGKPNYPEAARLWRAAAAQGMEDARTKLLVMTYNGEIVDGQPVTGEPAPEKVDKRAVFEQFKAEAAKGNRSSTYYYALCLLGAVPAVKDADLGRREMQRAAGMGDEQARAFCDRNKWKYALPPR